MGVQNIVTKQYLARNDVFASLFNYYVYDGKQVLRKENLTEADSANSILLRENMGKREGVERYRDILKNCVLKYMGDTAYLIVGVENQSEIHYGMPVRNMLYDAMSYVRQISEKRRGYRQERAQLSKAEFLSGLTREDRLIPVVTLVVYWGQEVWDAPCSLYEMLDCADEEILRCINDYRINLVNPHWMKPEDFEKLEGSLAAVMRFIKAAASEEDMKELLQKFKQEYSRMEQDAVEVIRACTKIEIKTNEKGLVIDMCKAWDDHWENGRKQGIEQGIEQGIDKQIVTSVRAIMESLEVSLEEACNVLKIKVSEYEKAKSAGI